MDTNKDLIGSTYPQHHNQEPSELDRKQSHTRFDYYGYDREKFFSASGAEILLLVRVRGSSRFDSDLLEHREDLEYD